MRVRQRVRTSENACERRKEASRHNTSNRAEKAIFIKCSSRILIAQFVQLRGDPPLRDSLEVDECRVNT